MTASVVRIRQRTVIQAKLLPRRSGDGPRVWFRYADGYEVISDTRVKTPDLGVAISLLHSSERAMLFYQLGEQWYAIARP
jgi:hypothetical protein